MKEQIEEMAKALTAYEKKLCDRLPKDQCLLTSAIHAQVSCDYCKIAEFLYTAGYRKSSEVAEEIFEEIDRMIYKVLNDRHYIMGDMCYEVEELKKKYTQDKGRDKIAEFGKYSPLSWKYTESEDTE